MIGEGLFLAIIVVFWLAEFAFGTLVVYWFVTQGFEDEGIVDAESIPLEDREYTRQSLMMWGGFFLAIVLLIVIGA